MKITALLLTLTLVACGESKPPAVTVGPVAFQESQLLGLSVPLRHTLANLTAFALAVSDSTTEDLGAPLLERQRDDTLLNILAADLLLQDEGVTDQVLEARYLTDPDYELTVRHILFMAERWKSPAERAAAEAKAEKALTLVKAGADFAQTAAKLSEEPGAAGRQGLLRPGRQGDWVDEFWNAASALKVGEISPVVETQYGYHVIKLLNRTVVPFAEARSRVAREVAAQIGDPQKAFAAWVDSVGAQVRISPEGLAEAADPAADSTTVLATWPGGTLTLKEYLVWAASHPDSWRAGGMGTDSTRFHASVEELARRRLALQEADRRHLEVPPSEIKAMDRAWGDSTYQWSASLDLRYGMTPTQVAREALSALGDPSQQVGLVRTAIDRREPLLAARYPIHVAGETPPSGQP